MAGQGEPGGCMKRLLTGCVILLLIPLLPLVLVVAVFALFNGRTGAPTDYSGSRMLASPPPPLTEPLTLKVVTFNVAAAYGFTTNRPERMRAIADVLARLDPDIVGLQEAFIARDRRLLVESLAETRLRHHVRFPAGTVGNGLLILSAWPIEESYFHRYEQSNPWYRIWEGDWWAGKGVGLARVRLPGGVVADFYNTHAQAGRGHRTRYLEVRTVQMEGLARFVNATAAGTGPAFVVGDFNTKLDYGDLQAAIAGAGLERIMTVPSNIDHIFAVRNPRYRFEVIGTEVIAGEVQGSKANLFLSRAPTPGELWRMRRGPGEMTSLSDHHGYMTTVRVVPVTGEAG